MKKIFALLLAASFGAAFLTSCGSTKIAIQEHSPVAVFSIIGNSQIPWTKDDPNDPDEAESDGLLSTMVNKLIDGQNPELVTAVDRLDYADASFRQILPEMTGCEVLSKEAVLSSEAYEDLNASYFNALSSTKSATDYKDMTTIGAKPARIAIEGVGAKSAAILNFTFQKKLLKGNKWNGELVGIVTMKAKLLNSRGKEIINKTYEVQVPTRVKISSHKYNKNTLVDSLNEGIDSVIRQFALEFIAADENSVELTDDSVKGQAIALPPRADSKQAQEAEVTETAEPESSANAETTAKEEAAATPAQ